jgi:hypothetical protein
MATQLSLTAPLALIKVKGRVVGRMRNIEIRETFRRVPVYGLGEATPLEIPFTQWNGTLSCGFYEIKFDETGIPGAVRRDVASKREFLDNMVLDSEGIDVVLLKRKEESIDPSTSLRKGAWEEHVTVKGCFIEGDSMDLSEGQIAGHNQNFSFRDPVLVKP